jgi:ATP-binding cassette subfamily B protein IrtA
MSKQQGIVQLIRVSDSRKGYLIAAVLLSCLSALCQLIPYLIAYLIMVEIIGSHTGATLYNAEYIQLLGWLSLVAIIVAGAALYVSAMLSHIAAFDIIYRLRLQLVRKLSELPLGYSQTQSKGMLKGIVMDETGRLESFIAHYLPDIATAILFSISVLINMFILDWRLALWMLIPVCAAMMVQLGAFRNKEGRRIMDEFFMSIGKMNGTIVEYVQGLPVLRAFNQTVYSFRRFYRDLQSFSENGKAYSINSIPSFALFLVALPASFVFIIPIGAYLLSRSSDYATLASIVFLFLILSNGLFVPILKLLYVGSRTRQLTKGLSSIHSVLQEMALTEGTVEQSPSSHDIRFDNVSFSYPNKRAVSELSFHAKEGSITALVGPSGAGKSTVASLILRYWDINEGSIFIGGKDIRSLRPETLYASISVVFQDNPLFSDTIMNNIRIGNERASDEEVRQAAKAAQCHEFISRLPQGYDTKVGGGSVHLSGGEKQRIAIARLILKDSPIVILDEATAYADAENEYWIQQAFTVLLKNKTVIIIAHRLSTIRHANQILVLDHGKLAEIGTHNELLASCGLYSAMWERESASRNWILKPKEAQEE